MKVLPGLEDGLDLGSEDAEICVVGRCDFASGLGAMTYAAW